MGIDVDEAPPGTRASMDGQVPETMSYQSWLSSQPAAVQDEALGPTRAALFRDGDLTVDRFTDSRGNALTLDQLEKRETEAFEKADIESAKPATAPEPEPVPEPEATPIAEDELLKAAEEPAPGPEPVLSIDQIIRSQSETDNALYERAESLPRGSDYLSLGRHGFSGGGSIDLSPLERQALSSYQGIGFEDINKALRQQVNMEGVDFDSEIVPIDRAMQKSVLDKDIRVWRGVWDYKQTYGVDDIEDLVGAEIKDLGYLSTSTDRNVAEEFVSFGDETNKKALLLEIAAPKGSRAVHMLEATGEASGEREILFDRGSKFRILRVEKNPDSAVRMKLIAVLVQ